MHTFTLLILGSKTEFTPLVRLAKEHGFRTVVADGNTGTEAKALADRAYDVDIRDAAAVAEIAKKEGADAITTAYSDLLFECAVRIADAAGLPYHLTPDLLPYYRDKSVMKKTMDDLGIKNAKSALLTGEDDAAAISSLRFPIVIKPLDLYGSRGLRVAGSPEEALAYARERYGTSGGDFGRARAQRLIVKAIIGQILEASPVEMPSLIGSLSACVKTDYTVAEALPVVMKFRGRDYTIYSTVCPSYSFEAFGVSYDGTMFAEWRDMMKRVDAGLDPNDTSVPIPEPQASNEKLGEATNSAAPQDYGELVTQSLNTNGLQ